MRKSNLGNVAMYLCSICNEPLGILLQTKDGSDAFDGKREVYSGDICDKCEKKLAEGISFFCHTCNSLHCIKPKGVKEIGIKGLKKGDKRKVYKCPQCNDGSFMFLPPEHLKDKK